MLRRIFSWLKSGTSKPQKRCRDDIQKMAGKNWMKIARKRQNGEMWERPTLGTHDQNSRSTC